MTRPFVSEPHPDVPPAYANRGYVIGGREHKPGCRCYACQTVRRRAREKRLRQALFNCG